MHGLDILSESFGQYASQLDNQTLRVDWVQHKIISFTKTTMSFWKTHMRLYVEQDLTENEYMEIRCGTYKGDSLSPLLFYISLIPLAKGVNKLDPWYEDRITKTKYYTYFIWAS
jgi:hypothetical protein